MKSLSDNKKGINKLENFEIKTYKMVLASKNEINFQN